MDKSPDAMRTISEAADELDLPQHVLRFWETRFTQIKPLKRNGGRRFYRPSDLELLRAIRYLLYAEGYTIKGVQKLLQEQGPRGLLAAVGFGHMPPEDMPKSVGAPPAPDEIAPLRPRLDKSAPRPAIHLTSALRQNLEQLRHQLRDCERLLDQARQPMAEPLRKAS